MVLPTTRQKSSGDLLARLNIKSSDKILSIREDKLGDSSFLVAHKLDQIFSTRPNDKVCLVALHNILGHYNTIYKKLGCDLLNKIKQERSCVVVDSWELLYGSSDDNDISFTQNLLSYIEIKKAKVEDCENWHVIIDDVSCLLDLGMEMPEMIDFLNILESSTTTLTIICYVVGNSDEILSNILAYFDVHVVVSSLPTGISNDVSGVVEIKRINPSLEMFTDDNKFHYKTFDKEISLFSPGEALNYLYK